MTRRTQSGSPIVVWGGTGFIGRSVVRSLLGSGYPVKVITRREFVPEFDSPTQPEIIVVHPGEGMAECLAPHIAAAEVVFNFAGVSGAVASNSNPAASLDGNCRIQSEFIHACKIAATRPHVVFASSRLVYGCPIVNPVPESAPTEPRSVYAAHKLCIEQYHQIAAYRDLLTFTNCRISNPYGPVLERQSGYGFISYLIARGLRGESLEIFGDGMQLRDYIHISDLTDALRLCAFRPEAVNKVLNIGSGHGISLLEAAVHIRSITGTPIVHLPWPKEYALVESGDYVADITLARGLLGFEPRYDFASGLSDLIRAMSPPNRALSVAKCNTPELSVT